MLVSRPVSATPAPVKCGGGSHHATYSTLQAKHVLLRLLASTEDLFFAPIAAAKPSHAFEVIALKYEWVAF